MVLNWHWYFEKQRASILGLCLHLLCKWCVSLWSSYAPIKKEVKGSCILVILDLNSNNAISLFFNQTRKLLEQKDKVSKLINMRYQEKKKWNSKIVEEKSCLGNYLDPTWPKALFARIKQSPRHYTLHINHQARIKQSADVFLNLDIETLIK